MTLNSSGPISLGGTTAGVSIEKELGGSGTTQISLNDANVRALAGVASGAITMPTNFYGKSSATYFVMGITPSSGGGANSGHQVNASSTNITLITNNSVNGWNTLYRISASGSLTSQTKITAGGGTLVASTTSIAQYTFVMDGSDNIYVDTGQSSIGAGFATISSSNTVNYCAAISSGSFNALSTQGTVAYYNSTAYSTVIGTQGACCCATYGGFYSFTYSGTTPTFYLWQSTNTGLMRTDSSGNIYIISDSGYLAKYTSVSSLSWFWTNSGGTSYTGVVNSAGSLFATWGSPLKICLYNIASVTTSVAPTSVAVYSVSAGSDGALDLSANSVAFDSSNNSYFTVFTNAATKYGFIVFKLNSSGTVQWARKFTCSYGGSNNFFQNLCITATGSYVDISFSQLISGSNYTTGFIRYPADGSKTGTYTAGSLSVVVANSTATTSSSTYPYNGTYTRSVIPGSTITKATRAGAQSTATNTVSFTTI